MSGIIAPPGFMGVDGSIEAEKRSIIEEFEFLGDWIQRYEYIIELGRKLPGLPEEMRTDLYKVPGCQSQVWFHARREGDVIHYCADSDAMIVRGLIALLLRIYSGRRPEEILATSPEFFEVLDLGSHLSGSRANGLHVMVRRIQDYARAYRDAANPVAVDPTTLGRQTIP